MAQSNSTIEPTGEAYSRATEVQLRLFRLVLIALRNSEEERNRLQQRKFEVRSAELIQFGLAIDGFKYVAACAFIGLRR